MAKNRIACWSRGQGGIETSGQAVGLREERPALIRRSEARFAAALTTLVLAACGSAGTHPGSTTPSLTPSVSGPLFAVLETQRAGVPSSNQGSPDTIAIAGLDGKAIAKTTFAPAAKPSVPMAVPVLAIQAHIAAGGVYFIDGAGVVRRLDPSGATRTIATFPISSSQQTASFAVRPDGKQLMATLFTHPSFTPGDPPYQETSPTKLDLEIASDGGTARTIQHWEGTTVQRNAAGEPQFHNLTMAGWDATGPIVLVDGHEAVQQQVIEGAQWAGGHLARLNLDGTVGASLTPPECVPYAIEQEGSILCTREDSSGGVNLDILSASGQLLWRTTSGIGMYGFAGGYALSPNGLRVAMNGLAVDRDGSRRVLPADFATRGWLNDQTIIGIVRSSNAFRVVRLDAPTVLEEWGFSGQFVGRISPGSS